MYTIIHIYIIDRKGILLTWPASFQSNKKHVVLDSRSDNKHPVLTVIASSWIWSHCMMRSKTLNLHNFHKSTHLKLFEHHLKHTRITIVKYIQSLPDIGYFAYVILPHLYVCICGY